MGLEKLLVGLYGTTPQIDLDKKIARVRVPKPMEFDFAVIGNGVIKNNMGLGGITVSAPVTIVDGTAIFQSTGQKVPFRGPGPTGSVAQLIAMRVIEPLEPDKTALELAK